MLSAILRKANNFFDFLFVSLVDETLPKREFLLKKRIGSEASQCFQEMTKS